MWCVWPRRGAYEPEFGELSRDRPGSRQNRDRIGPGARDLATAHVTARGLVGMRRPTATGPDPVDWGPCLSACPTWPSDQFVRCRARDPIAAQACPAVSLSGNGSGVRRRDYPVPGAEWGLTGPRSSASVGRRSPRREPHVMFGDRAGGGCQEVGQHQHASASAGRATPVRRQLRSPRGPRIGASANIACERTSNSPHLTSNPLSATRYAGLGRRESVSLEGRRGQS